MTNVKKFSPCLLVGKGVKSSSCLKLVELFMSQEQQPMTEQEILNWARDAYQKIMGFLGEQGLVIESLSESESRYLAPFVAVWKLKTTEGKWVWAISGDLPSDFISSEGATSARETLRAFSMRWQMKVEKIRNNADIEEEQKKLADLMEERAVQLYQVFEDDTFWQSA